MNISQLLSPEATICGLKLTSKKKVLERVSEVLAESTEVDSKEIFDSLLAREKLGSTALGNGIAIPHARVEDCVETVAVFLLLDDPVDYDAPDGQPVDIIFAIMVSKSASKEQLSCLAEIAKILSQPNVVSQIRHAHCDDALFDIIEAAGEKSH